MSEVISGTIDSIYTKIITTKYGDKPVYHAMVNGHDVNLGFKTAHHEGEVVQLPVEVKYGGYQLIQGPKPTTNGAVQAQVQPMASAPSPNVQSKPAFPIPNNTKDTSIIRQSSLNRAVETISQMIDHGVFTPKTEQDFMDKVFEIAYQYTDFGTGQREVKHAEAMAGYKDE